MHKLVVKLSDLSFLSDADLEENKSELGAKIIRQFAFLPGDIKVTIAGDCAQIEFTPPTPAQIGEAARLCEKGTAAARSGEFREAIDLYKKALAANPLLSATHRDIAMVHYELGEFESAKDHLIAALRLDPNDAWNHVVLANIFTRQGDLTSAIRFFSRALELKPGDPYALNGLGAAHAKSGNSTKAHECFDAAIAAKPDFAEPKFGKALLFQKQGLLAASSELLEQICGDPGDVRFEAVAKQARQLLASVKAELREQGGPTNP